MEFMKRLEPVWLALIIFWVENYIANRVPLQPVPEMGEG